MKLSTLNFKMTGSAIDGANQITFDCPLCGIPYRVSIYAVLNGQPKNSIFNWRCGSMTDIDSISISPSIINATHGRKKNCGWHGNITNGEVTNA